MLLLMFLLIVTVDEIFQANVRPVLEDSAEFSLHFFEKLEKLHPTKDFPQSMIVLHHGLISNDKENISIQKKSVFLVKHETSSFTAGHEV
jgi:hypothetical protein